MTAPDPGVYISSAQMYQEMRTVHDAVTRVESKVDGLRDDNKDIRALQSDHESRLRALERSRWPVPTVAALAGVTGAATGIMALLQR